MVSFPKKVGLIVGLLAAMTGAVYAESNAGRDRNAADFWQSDRARLLDQDDFRVALSKAEKGGAPKKAQPQAKAPKATAAELVQLFLAELRTEEGVHVETALSALGSVAGFSCQMAIRDGFVKKGMVTLDKAFWEIETKSGDTFYSGPLVNECLTAVKKGQYSVWTFVAGAA